MRPLKGTKPERIIAELLRQAGLAFEEHARDLRGRPDIVLRQAKILVFVEGDFWHGWRFPAWRLKLSEQWERKIEGNRVRDLRNLQALRRAGWRVIRIWEHQVERDPERCIARVLAALNAARAGSQMGVWRMRLLTAARAQLRREAAAL